MGVLAGDGGIGLLDNLLTLGQDQLDVAGVRHVGVDLDAGLLVTGKHIQAAGIPPEGE